MINCEHWKDCGIKGGGCCSINKYSKPSYGVCNYCRPELKVTKEIVVPNKVPTIPSLMSQGMSFFKAMMKVSAAAMTGKQIKVPDEILEERTTICASNKCGHFDGDNGRCTACGCGFANKLPLATEKCPRGHWSKYVG